MVIAAGVIDPPVLPLELVDIIDFKWLMAREGHHVHVQRMQDDASYARDCIDIGSRSAIEPLRAASRKLARALDQAAG